MTPVHAASNRGNEHASAPMMPPSRSPAPAVASAGQATGVDAVTDVTLDLPPEITMTAPSVHVPAESEIVWRLVGSKEGKYEVKIAAAGQSAAKAVCVGSDLPRISTIRLRGHFWERMFSSAEPALPENSPIESISINYPDRNIEIAGYGMNWIWLFFILSMVAGFVFKELLGIKI